MYGVRKFGSTAKPKLEVSAAGLTGKVIELGGVKKGSPAVGSPVQPELEHVPEKRGALAKVNCWEPSMRDVAGPGDPFWSLSIASA